MVCMHACVGNGTMAAWPAEHLQALACGGEAAVEQAVQAPRPQQCRIQHVRPRRRAHHYHACARTPPLIPREPYKDSGGRSFPTQASQVA